MRALVVYYSRTGSTKKLAAAIGAALEADVEQIIDRTPRSGKEGYVWSLIDAAFARLTDIEQARFDPKGYDVVVVGTPIWNASLSTPVRTYLARHRHDFAKLAVFCTCGGWGGSRVRRQVIDLTQMPVSAFLALRDSELGEAELYPAVAKFCGEIRMAVETGAAPALRAGVPRSADGAAPSKTWMP